ncbi:uncharacterized protein LOC9654774 isoform X3 [Selaginella moellendorffii]|nr:uncharacterized protein LOC9654774 isoform X3 [Selaginella moellendorffii]XP_024543990.1 uncharacterized protein LOC9654774 isoform X3 [Selaginella moellendorffii]|eukprot:XP_024543989.1 uncharacterized protein LOC9654774 isoform X3 [Selaginella moellendorffii]
MAGLSPARDRRGSRKLVTPVGASWKRLEETHAQPQGSGRHRKQHGCGGGSRDGSHGFARPLPRSLAGLPRILSIGHRWSVRDRFSRWILRQGRGSLLELHGPSRAMGGPGYAPNAGRRGVLRRRAKAKILNLKLVGGSKPGIREQNLVSNLGFFVCSMATVAAQISSRGANLIAVIADEDTVTGFLLAGVGNVDLRRKTNYLLVDSKTTVKTIEETFRDFTTREDIAVILISQYIANMIRLTIDAYSNPIPAILEIPSKDHPYDPSQDSILSRVKHMFSGEPASASRQ